jgi:hypothetical protein
MVIAWKQASINWSMKSLTCLWHKSCDLISPLLSLPVTSRTVSPQDRLSRVPMPVADLEGSDEEGDLDLEEDVAI